MLPLSGSLSGFDDFSLTGTTTLTIDVPNVFTGLAPEITLSVDGSLSALGQSLEGQFVIAAQIVDDATVVTLNVTAATATVDLGVQTASATGEGFF